MAEPGRRVEGAALKPFFPWGSEPVREAGWAPKATGGGEWLE